MIRHYLAVALAKLRKTPFTTAANVLTLALGLACFIAAFGVVTAWRTADRHFANAERSYIVSQRGGVHTAAAVGHYLREDVPELEAVARVSLLDNRSDLTLSAGGRSVSANGVRAEAAFLDIFDFQFIAGDRASALAGPGSLVITRSTAERLFGDKPALGQTVRWAGQWSATNGALDLEVTGVIEDPPEASHMRAGGEGVTPLEYFWLWPDDLTLADRPWLEEEFVTYALLPADGSLSVAALNARLTAMAERRIPDLIRGAFNVTLEAVPLADVRERQIEIAVFGDLAGRVSLTSVVLWLGALILVVACFNYSNLLTAETISRTREFGMRKALGAERTRILAQVWLEAGLLTLLALLAALVAIALSTPALRAQTGVDLLDALLADARFLILVVGLAAAVTMGSGAYPAFMCMRVRPAQALAARGTPAGSRLLVMALVGAQFAAASGLMIGVIVLRDQNALLRNATVTQDGDPVAVLNFSGSSGVAIDTLRARLESYPQIVRVSESSSLPWTSEVPGIDASYVPFDDPESSLARAWRAFVGYGFFEALGIEVLAGRGYDEGRDGPDREERIVIDRQYAERLGFAAPEDAIGAQIRLPPGAALFGVTEFPPIEIIGVVENSPLFLYGAGVDGTVFRLEPGMDGAFPIVRVDASDVEGGLEIIEREWNALAPDMPLNLRFADGLFEQSYRVAGRIGMVFTVLSLAAFAISAMGLFAMATHITRGRVQEVGVRKTIGATTLRIVGLFLRSFSLPVIVANLVAWPVAYLAAQAYLSSFLMRIELTAWPFTASLAVTLALAWIVVLSQTLKAASVRPAEVLRHA